MKNFIFSTSMLLFVFFMSSFSNSSGELESEDLFCASGWSAVDRYYDLGGNDGFVAGVIFENACAGMQWE